MRGGRSGKRLAQTDNILQANRRDTTENSRELAVVIFLQECFPADPHVATSTVASRDDILLRTATTTSFSTN